MRTDGIGERFVVSGAREGAALLHARLGRLIHTFGDGPTFAVAMHPSSPLAALGGDDGRISFWSLKSFRVEGPEIDAGDGKVVDLDYHPDGTQVAAASLAGGGTLFQVWDTATHALIFRQSGPAPTGTVHLRFSPSGDRLVATDGGAWTRLWARPGDLALPRAVPSFEPALHRAVADPSATGPLTVDLVEPLPPLVTPPATPAPAGALQLSPDGTRVLVRTEAGLAVSTVGSVDSRPLEVSAGASGPFVFSGRRLLGFADGTILFWDLDTGAAVGRVPSARPRAVAWEKGALVMAFDDGHVEAGAGGEGGLKRVPKLARVTSVAIDRTRTSRVAIGMEDGGVRILDLKKLEPTSTTAVATGPVTALAFSPDGERLVAAGGRPGTRDGVVTVLEKREDSVAHSFVVDGVPTRLEVSANGERILAVSPVSTTVYDVPGEALLLDAFGVLSDGRLRPDGREVTRLEERAGVRRLAVGDVPLAWVPRGSRMEVSTNGRAAALVDGDRITLWDGLAGLRRVVLPAGVDAVRRAIFDAGGAKFAVLYEDRTVEVIEAATGVAYAGVAPPPPGAPDVLQFSEDGAWIWTMAGPRTVVAQEVASGAEKVRIELPGAGALTVAEAFTHGRFVVLDGDRRVWVDTAPDALRRVYDESEGPRPLAVHPGGVFAAVAQGDTVWRMDLRSGRRVGPELTIPGATPGVAGAFDGEHLAVGYADGLVRVWDHRAVVSTIGADAPPVGREGDSIVTSLFFDAAGMRLTGLTPTGRPRTWDWHLTYEVASLLIGAQAVRIPSPVAVLRVSADGATLYSSHADGIVRVWDLDTGAQRGLLSGHADVITAIDATTDGKRLATGSIDGSARVWDGDTFVELATLPTFGDRVRAVAISPDGSRVAAYGDGGVLRTWRTRRGEQTARWEGKVPGMPTLRWDGDTVEMAWNGGAARFDVKSGGVAPMEPWWTPPSAVGPIPAGGRGSISTMADGRIYLFDLAEGFRARLTALTDGAWVLDRADGTRIASRSLRDGTAPRIHYDDAPAYIPVRRE